jgi:hypothetical protein
MITILNSASVRDCGGIAGGAERLASPPIHFIHGDMSSIIQWIGGWVSSRAALDVVEKKEFILCSE